VQLGLTATPKRTDNVDTYAYFGDPAYVYSLKEGINDGFLTPFKVKQIQTTLDSYIHTPDDPVIAGVLTPGKLYGEKDFNSAIQMFEREGYRVKVLLDDMNANEKTLVFCKNQVHALLIRDLISQSKASTDPNYCQRVSADDGDLGEQHLRDFQDNEKAIPTILTTSHKLSTGVDARNIRNIVLMRPVDSMIEFKQIIGRGTRLFEGKDYFTIYDFVEAHHNFSDPEWDGEPAEVEVVDGWSRGPRREPVKVRDAPSDTPPPRPEKIVVTLAPGKERTIQHMMSTSYWHPDGRPISAQQFMQELFGELPAFFKDEDELRALRSDPETRKKLLEGLAEKGFGAVQLAEMQKLIDAAQLAEMQKLIDAAQSDLFDVLAYIAYALPPVTRADRAAAAKAEVEARFEGKLRAFLGFVLSQYVAVGVDQLDTETLSPLLRRKYNDSLSDAMRDLGGNAEAIRRSFAGFQKYLYQQAG
jgi:type I restriction enzyme R subunit